MKHTCSLTLVTCLAFAGCQHSKPKSTWQKVRDTKPDNVAATADPSEAYTAKLHKMLVENKVEHKVVTYQYRYQTRMREEAVGTHSSIIYKDNSDPQNPWWLVNERTGKPVWLPGQDLNKQVAFYLRRKADVLEQKEFTGGDTQPVETMVAKNTPVVPPGSVAVTRIARTHPTPVRETAVAQSVPHAESAPFIRPARFGTTPHEMTIPFTKPAPADSQYDEQFRRVHGTDYDPSSVIDRQKMETLKHALLDQRESAPVRTF